MTTTVETENPSGEIFPTKLPEKEQNISEAIRMSLAEDNEEENTSEPSNDASNSSVSSFSALTTDSSNEESEKSSIKKKKDILHRDIEKRRRERINRSLVKLKELVPTTKDSMKCNGNSRLQKAKLLEMTVEYLSSLSKPNIDGEKKPERSQQGSPTKTVIAESAKEIYLTGYKAATDHILKKLTQCYNISGKDLENLTNNIGLSSDISIPNMMLVPPPSLKFDENNVTNYPEHEKHFNGSPIYLPSKAETKLYTEMNMFDSVKKTETGQSFAHSNPDERRVNDNKPPSRSSSSSGVYSSDENTTTSSILLSCLIQDPVTAQYSASLLPLDSILPPDYCQSLPYTYLQKQGKLTMEALADSRKAATSPPPPQPPPKLHSVSPHSPSYQRHHQTLPPSRSPGVTQSSQSDHHNQLYTTLKRKYSEDSQVSVIMNQPQPKRPPNLLPGSMVSSSSHLSPNEHPTSLQSMNMQPKMMNNPSYFRELGIRHESNYMSEIARKNSNQGADYDLSRDNPNVRGLFKTSSWLVKGNGWN